MASETESPVSHPSRISGNMDFSDFPPFILGFTNAELGDRLILLSPLTGGVFVVEAGTGSDRSSSSSLDSLLAGILGKDGLPPASKASIEALRSVEIGEEEEEEDSFSNSWYPLTAYSLPRAMSDNGGMED